MEIKWFVNFMNNLIRVHIFIYRYYSFNFFTIYDLLASSFPSSTYFSKKRSYIYLTLFFISSFPYYVLPDSVISFKEENYSLGNSYYEMSYISLLKVSIAIELSRRSITLSLFFSKKFFMAYSWLADNYLTCPSSSIWF